MSLIPIKLPYDKRITRSEKSLFEKASRSLKLKANDCYLFHSLNLTKVSGTKKIKGEVDFVYLDKKFLLFLEVKGGQVYYKSSENRWFTMGGDIEKDPFEQVAESLFSTRKDLKELERFKDKNYHNKLILGYGVLFPEAEKPKEFDKSFSKEINKNTIEYNLDIVYDIRDHNNYGENGFEKYIDKLKQHWSNHPKYKEHKNFLTNDELEDIRKYFRDDLVFDIPLLEMFNKDENDTKIYTQEQIENLETIFTDSDSNEGKGFFIKGAPGTGKTVIALEKAKQLYESGKKILFICFNKNLSFHLSERIKNITNDSDSEQGLIEVYNIHKFLSNFINKEDFKDAYNNIKYGEDFWNKTLPGLFLKKFKEKDFENKYDFLIIDEGQDIFTEELIDCLDKVFTNGFESGKWLVFLDNIYQTLYGKFDELYFKTFRSTYNCLEWSLNRNCRNTPNIVEEASIYTGMGKTKCLKEELLDPELKFYSSDSELIKIINEKVSEYLNKGVKHENIVILTKNNYIEKLVENNPNLYEQLSSKNIITSNGKIRISTPHSFKGLESQIIIFAGYDQYDKHNKELMSEYYVAYTRAGSHLVVVLSNKIQSSISKAVMDNLKKKDLK